MAVTDVPMNPGVIFEPLVDVPQTSIDHVVVVLDMVSGNMFSEYTRGKF